MIPSFIITFRETLEVALVVGIILSYLKRINQTRYNTMVYAGLGLGVLASIAGAFLFNAIAGGFTGQAEEIFEGVTMLFGAALLTGMIIWMMRQKHVAAELEQRVAAEVSGMRPLGLLLLVFVSVLREGVETVIFLGATSLVSAENNLVGALTGIVVAVLLGYIIFFGSMRINLKQFFNVTSVLLILFAAGLVAHGVHELQEARVFPTIVEHIWDINPPVEVENIYPLLHEKGHIGSILQGLFGYNGNPSLVEVASYLLYLGLAAVLWNSVGRGKKHRIKSTPGST